MNACLVLTTFPDKDAAETFVGQALQQGLAACVHIAAPVDSYYIWQSAVKQTTEFTLTIKTTVGALAALEQLLRASHPYEVPEWLVLNAAAAQDYGAWLNEVVLSD